MNRFFFVIMSVTFCLQAVHSEEMFLEGNQHFVAAQFSEAVASYKQVVNPSSVVLMNMGIAYFNMEDYAQARLAFVQAQKNSEGSLYRQISRCQRELDAKLGFEEERKYQDLLIDIVHFIPIFLLQLWVILCFLLILYCIFRKKSGTFQAIFYILFLFGSSVWLYRYRLSQNKVAVIMTNTDLHAGPDLLFLKKNVIPLGKVFRVVREGKDMVQIITDEQQGWVSSQNLTLV